MLLVHCLLFIIWIIPWKPWPDARNLEDIYSFQFRLVTKTRSSSFKREKILVDRSIIFYAISLYKINCTIDRNLESVVSCSNSLAILSYSKCALYVYEMIYIFLFYFNFVLALYWVILLFIFTHLLSSLGQLLWHG